MEIKELNGKIFAKALQSGVNNLYINRQLVNDLNVFPVPDGDTGDNMYMTLAAGYESIENEKSTHLGDLAGKVSKGMLLGARGNSGVILSRIVTGIAEGFSGKEKADIRTIIEALENGVTNAYAAVMRPVEGTILTVYKDATKFAKRNISEESTLETVFMDFLNEMKESLDRTPQLLAALREAGVVDSGGAGLLYIAEGIGKVLQGEFVDRIGEDSGKQEEKLDFDGFTEDSELEYGYCTEFLLRLQSSKVKVESFSENTIKDYLVAVGESVVCFKEGSIVKVHVHTKTPGEILNHCQQYGEYLKIKIENMALQHNEIEKKTTVVKKHKKYGVVTVASGKGIIETFKNLGADEVVEGGQSMNPSANDFLEAFQRINADTIFVFPNNSNIILTAKQAAELYKEKKIRIIESRTIGEGYAAISMMDTGLSEDEIEEEANEVIAETKTAMVSKCSRDCEMDQIQAKSGDYIGFEGGRVYIDSADREDCAKRLVKKMQIGSFDIALLIYGKDVPKDVAEQLQQLLKEKYKQTEVILVKGDQPIYEYIMVLM